MAEKRNWDWIRESGALHGRAMNRFFEEFFEDLVFDQDVLDLFGGE
jgi:hypothetical protein